MNSPLTYGDIAPALLKYVSRETESKPMNGQTRGFHTYGANAKALVETLIIDLKMNTPAQSIDADDGSSTATRREAVIILYASGGVGVFEGWNVKRDDIPELLAARVLKD